MFALCIESSHARGMGHLYRAINLVDALSRAGQRCTVLVNDDAAALRELAARGIPAAVVDLMDDASDWEGACIDRLRPLVWINDRLDTDARHATRVRRHGVALVTFDDRGSGAEHADLHVAALAFDETERLGGRRVLRGVEVLILNPSIARHRRARTTRDRLLVTMGGSDTFGVSVAVAECLRESGAEATIVIGPSFAHDDDLRRVCGDAVTVKRHVPSLIAEFERYDLAVTAGGITPFEANASGLPCVVIATEPFEVPVGQALAAFGGSVFAGFRTSFDRTLLTSALPIAAMSCAGLARIPLDGAGRVVEALLSV